MAKKKQTVVHKHYSFRCIVQLACIFGAIKLMLNGTDGWGWLLLIAACM
ncbi:TPA: hypothetical protein RSV87_001819 [Mannheimia haemolytica]|nr:hypothetical protein [Mannheimia haemolytica]